MPERKIEIRDSAGIVEARQAGREKARELGFGPADQTRIATAISELTRNVVQYAGEGICTVYDEATSGKIFLRVVVEDRGPGIPDVEQAMEHGFSTGKGLGAGLLGAKRLVHQFRIESRPGATRVEITLSKSALGG